MKGLSQIFRTIGGELEIGRTLLVSASTAAIFTPIGFQIWEMAKGGHFDVTAWCVAYPGGLVALVAGGVMSVGAKDQQVAKAKVTTAAGETQS